MNISSTKKSQFNDHIKFMNVMFYPICGSENNVADIKTFVNMYFSMFNNIYYSLTMGWKMQMTITINYLVEETTDLVIVYLFCVEYSTALTIHISCNGERFLFSHDSFFI